TARPEIEAYAVRRANFAGVGLLSGKEPEFGGIVRPQPTLRKTLDAPGTSEPATPHLPLPVPPAPIPEMRMKEPVEWTGDEPDFLIPEWESLGCSAFKPADASRHFLVLGQSGSGKTKSALLPIAKSALRYPESGD